MCVRLYFLLNRSYTNLKRIELNAETKCEITHRRHTALWSIYSTKKCRLIDAHSLINKFGLSGQHFCVSVFAPVYFFTEYCALHEFFLFAVLSAAFYAHKITQPGYICVCRPYQNCVQINYSILLLLCCFASNACVFCQCVCVSDVAGYG